MRNSFFLLALLSVCANGRLQAQATYVDTLKRFIDTSSNYTEVTNKCMDVAEELYYTDFRQAILYLEKGLQRAKAKNDYSNIGKYYLLKSQNIDATSGENKEQLKVLLADSSIEFYTKAIKTEKNKIEKEKQALNRASAYAAEADALMIAGEYEKSIESYLKAMNDYEVTELPEKYHGMANLTGGIAGIYIQLENYRKALEYDQKGLSFLKRSSTKNEKSEERDICTFYCFLADDCNRIDSFELAGLYLDSALVLAEKLNENNLWIGYYLRKGLNLSKKGSHEAALEHYQKGMQYAIKDNKLVDVFKAKRNIGEKLVLLGRLNEGRTYLMQAKQLADSLKLKYGIDLYRSFMGLEEKSGNYKKAFEYSELLRKTSDSLKKKEMETKVARFEKQYASEKKDSQLKLQQADIKRKQVWNYSLAIGIAALSLITIVGFRNYRNKQKVQQLKITELETEKKLSATEAVLKGEEQERTRLAKDLHDGLGGMLSGIKYSFNNMKENLILTPDTAQAFSRSMDMLDNSIKEMRRVAHNMMPESLMRYGLYKTLQDYTAEINKSGMVNVAYQSMGMENKTVDNTTAITIYRIVQELLNNVTKHAGAKQVLVQLLAQGNKLVVNVEDDGKGFDTSIIERAEGIGWKNIKSRVEFLKGTLDVQSSDGKGTAVNMEFNI